MKKRINITNGAVVSDTASVKQYLKETSKAKALSKAQELELAQRAQAGDTRAANQLVTANLRFVVSVAKQYQNQGLALIDLINEGNLGLIKAAQRFDETRGFKFISYAVWWIRQSIMQAISESRMVRLPMNKISSLQRINKAFTHLEQEFEREPVPEELATILNVELEEVQATLGIAGRHVSMDAPFAAGEQYALIDVLENPNAEEADRNVSFRESLGKEIERMLSTLPYRQREIIELYFGIGVDHPLSLDDIATRLHLTRERVRQLQIEALNILQDKMRRHNLQDHEWLE